MFRPVFTDAMSSPERQSASETPGMYSASDFPGEDGGECIQNAVDAASTDFEHAVVLVGPHGPDEDDGWLLSKTVELPSHTSLILVGSTLRLADGVGDNVIRNEHATSGDDARDSDIHILGFGDARIDGNATEQYGEIIPVDEDGAKQVDDHAGNDEYEYFRRNAVDLYKVDRFSLRGFSVGPTNSYAIAPEDVTYGYISDITFRQDGRTHNQDAVNLGGPAHHIQLVNLRGRLNDGAITISSRGTASSHKLATEGGDVRNVHVENVCFEGVNEPGHMGIIHTWPFRDAVLEHVRVRNVVGRNLGNPAFRTGGEYVTDEGPFTRPELHRDVVLDGIYADGDALCELRCDISDLTIRNAYVQGTHRLFDQRGYEVRGLALENCVQVTDESIEQFKSPPQPNSVTFDGPLTRASVERCSVELDNDDLRRGLLIDDGSDITDLSVDALGVTNAEVGIETHENSSFDRLAVTDCRFETVSSDFELDREAGLLRNGIGREYSTDGTPAEDVWRRGDLVELRDPCSGSVSAVFLALGDSNYVRLEATLEEN